MKVIYLSVIGGLTICFAFSVQAGHGSKGLHRSHQQFHLHGQHGQHHRERERSHTHGNVMKREREREREKPNGVLEEQRQEQRTNAAGQTQTRSQERIIPPR